MSLGESPQWRQRVALSWQAMSELARRHPSGAIFQEWPAASYDELLFVDGPTHSHNLIGFNRDGSVHIEPEWYEAGAGWWHVSVSGPRQYATRIEAATGLIGPATTPTTTRKTLAYRVISEVCNQSLLTDTFLDPRPGYTAWDGDGSVEDHHFKHFLKAAEHMNREAAPFDTANGVLPPHHFWFFIPHSINARPSEPLFEPAAGPAAPVAVIDTTATLWLHNGTSIDLMVSYKRLGREFLPLMLEVFPLLAPSSS
jgi:hypothetical protein